MAEIIHIPLHLLDLAEHDLRAVLDEDALEELAQDIRKNGLYYPLRVKPKGERWEVVDGGRRLRAMRRLSMEAAPCMPLDENGPPPEEVKLKCNLLRENNTDAEIAVWLGELVEHHGYNLEQLCAATGRSETWVNDRIDLLRGDTAVLEALGERKINFSQAKALNRCKDQQLRVAGLHYAICDNVPAARLAQWLGSNLPAPPVPPDGQQMPAPAAADAGPMGPGIVCDYCGGFKDPFNMVQVWLHRWEWTMVQQILNRMHEEAGKPTS